MPHGGGVRLPYRGADYVTLQRWIEQGTPRRIPGEPTLSSVTIVPEQESLRPEETQQLQVTAHYSDGSQRDVTHRTTFQSNEAAVVGVTDDGDVARWNPSRRGVDHGTVHGTDYDLQRDDSAAR